jgi:hypothetical protein
VYVRQEPAGWICDREALALWLGRSVETIRRRVPVVGYLRNGAALHNMEQAALILDATPRRSRTAA